MDMHSQDNLMGTFLGGAWRIEKRLGRGGMGTVYAATHVRNRGQVAVKVLHLDASRDPDIVRRFLREGYLANRVSHPGVPRVYDDGLTSDGCAFLIMDLLKGETLESYRLAEGGAVSVPRAIEIMTEVLDILASAHKEGIAHRDVKPDNVFLTSDGHVKLLDFGIAGLARSAKTSAVSSHTGTGVGWGTPQFMAPEQLTGAASCGPAVDVWAAGVTFFKLVTGRYPFRAQTLLELMEAHKSHVHVPLLDLIAPSAVSIAIADVIDCALSKKPSDRFSDAGEMLRALRAAAAASSSPPARTHESMTLMLATVPRILVAPRQEPHTPTTYPAARPERQQRPLPPVPSHLLAPTPRRPRIVIHSATGITRQRNAPTMPAASKRGFNQPHLVIGFLVLSIATFVSSAFYSFKATSASSASTTTMVRR